MKKIDEINDLNVEFPSSYKYDIVSGGNSTGQNQYKVRRAFSILIKKPGFFFAVVYFIQGCAVGLIVLWAWIKIPHLGGLVFPIIVSGSFMFALFLIVASIIIAKRTLSTASQRNGREIKRPRVGI